jgi:YegS/Rv2252/BmrU family lipid kinase
VLNPVSGRGRGTRERPAIEAALRAREVPYRVAISDYAGHLPVLVRRALDEGVRHVVAAGGDGTMHEAVNAILGHRAGADATLAPLPLGTGNDWCRSLGITADSRALAERCGAGRDLELDVGEAVVRGAPPRYFANVAGAGFDAYVLQQMRDRRFGAAAYLIAVLRGLTAYRPQPMRIESDGGAFEGRAFVAFVCVGRYCGGGMHVAPRADLRDGAFDVVLVGDLGRVDVLLSLRRLFDGTIASHTKVRTWRCTRLELEGAAGLGVEADGEVIGATPVALRVLPRALRVRVD